MTIGDSRATAVAATVRSLFYDFFEYVRTPNPKWLETNIVQFDDGASASPMRGYVRHVKPNGHFQDFQFEVSVEEQTLQFTVPFSSVAFGSGEQSALCAWFRLLTRAGDEGHNPQVIFATGAGKLAGFQVHYQSTNDIGPCILCYDGRQLVLVYVERAALEDECRLPKSSMADLNLIVDSNRPAFERIACTKYLRRESKPYETQGQTFPRIIITRADLQASGEKFSVGVLESETRSFGAAG